jgi:hypothetical protein
MIVTYYLHGVVDVPVRSELGFDIHVTEESLFYAQPFPM